ncbi:MAG: hypothetical protein F6J94_04185 [Moorea sp. SIO1F2]|uniref:hypothetical protein n=1 Tax=Moorena sp. SIO1F2 TaxID=2607819 RepID=UPI0013B75E3F|nr:hypothetical protein [Moorena sp. SIO1F2]NET81179.1 hypothetical protein [Moorena sp. SIO1F2]
MNKVEFIQNLGQKATRARSTYPTRDPWARTTLNIQPSKPWPKGHACAFNLQNLGQKATRARSTFKTLAKRPRVRVQPSNFKTLAKRPRVRVQLSKPSTVFPSNQNL